MITLSPTVKKANKATAFKWLLALKSGEELTPDQLDSILLFFAPKTRDKAKCAMEWVAKAASVNDARKQLQYVCVTQGIAYASDGHAMHRAAVKVDDGYYCPKTLLKVAFDQKPLDFARVFKGPADGFQLKTHLSNADKSGIRPKIGNVVHVTCASFEGGAPDDLSEFFIEKQLIASANNNPDPSFWLQRTGNKKSGAPQYRAYGSCEFGDWLVMSLND